MTDSQNPYEPPSSERGGVPVGRAVPGESLTGSMLESLGRTRPWAMFLSILGFIGGGFSALVAVSGIAVAVAEGQDVPVLVGVGGFYLALAAVHLVLAFFLVRYARAIGAVNATGRTEEVEDALWAQQRFWKTAGVVTIAMIALSIVGTIATIAVIVVAGY